MDPKEILAFCLEKGLLIDEDVLNLFSGTTDSESTKLIIESIKTHISKRIITRSVFENKEDVEKVLSDIPHEKIKQLKIKLGLSIEISSQKSEILANSSKLGQINRIKRPEVPIYDISPEVKETKIRTKALESEGTVKIVSSIPAVGKKLEVGDFVKYFRNRFTDMRNILQERPELDKLLSINKISGNKHGISIVGIVSDKRITKNQNILLDVEDLTGKMRVLISQSKKKVMKKLKI